MIAYKVIQTGSKGNAVQYNEVMVDCGVSYSKVPTNIKLVLLTHIHKDHFNKDTLIRLSMVRDVEIVCCAWLSDELARLGIEHEVLEFGKIYDFGICKVCPVQLYHDVMNCGYRIYFGNEKVFHATDTVTLDGITAKGYDIYGIEFNYDEETIHDVIRTKEERGEFCYEKGAINSHLSFQKAQAFYDSNKKESSQLIKLHMSSRYDEKK